MSSEFLVEIHFKDGWENFATVSTDYNNTQYPGRIDSISGFSSNMGEYTYETSPVTIVFDDHDYHFRNILVSQTNRFITGRTVIIRKPTGQIVRTTKIESWSLPEGQFSITCSNRIGMDTDFTKRITTDEWVYAADSAVNQAVPKAYNTFEMLPAHLINTQTNYGQWMLGTVPIDTVTRIEVGGTDYSNSAAVTWNIGNDGTNYFINLGHGVVMGKGKVAYVNGTTTAQYTPVDIIADALSGVAPVASNTQFRAFLAANGYTSAKCGFLLNQPMTPGEILKKFCISFECNWRWNPEGEIQFVYVDTVQIQVTEEFTHSQFQIDSPGNYDPDSITSEVGYIFAKNHQTGNYAGTGTYTESNSHGEYKREIQLDFIQDPGLAELTAQRICRFRMEPAAEYSFEIDAQLVDQVFCGDFIRLQKDSLFTPNPVLFQVKRINARPDSGKVSVTALEKNYLAPTFYLWANGLPLMANGYKITL